MCICMRVSLYGYMLHKAREQQQFNINKYKRKIEQQTTKANTTTATTTTALATITTTTK